MTLASFSSYRRCSWFLVIRDKETSSEVDLCSGSERERNLFESMSNAVELNFYGTGDDLPQFILEYKGRWSHHFTIIILGEFRRNSEIRHSNEWRISELWRNLSRQVLMTRALGFSHVEVALSVVRIIRKIEKNRKWDVFRMIPCVPTIEDKI